MHDRRKHSQTFEYLLLAVLMILFLAILIILGRGNPAADVKPTFSGWGGTILAMIGMIVAFFFGSSKGSRQKDEVAQAQQSIPPSGSPPPA